MNVIQKMLGPWTDATLSITRHEDESASNRKAVLQRMRQFLDDEEANMDQRDYTRLEQMEQEFNANRERALAPQVAAPNSDQPPPRAAPPSDIAPKPQGNQAQANQANNGNT